MQYLIWKLSHMVLNIEVGVGEPANLGGKKSVWKVLILLHKLAPQRFHVNVIVSTLDEIKVRNYPKIQIKLQPQSPLMRLVLKLYTYIGLKSDQF